VKVAVHTHHFSCHYLGFKSKNNMKFCNSASHMSHKCINSFIGSTLDLLEPCLSETVEIVSDLFLFSHSYLISKSQCLGYYTTNL
jgi:hypothetical protein